MKELPRKPADIVRNGELKDCGMREILDLADELGIDVAYLPRSEAIRRMEKEVRRADSIKRSYEVEGPEIECGVGSCLFSSMTTYNLEYHEVFPGMWYWICKFDVATMGLREGK